MSQEPKIYWDLSKINLTKSEADRKRLLEKWEDTGINVGALLENLQKTPTERLEQLKRRLILIERFKKGEF